MSLILAVMKCSNSTGVPRHLSASDFHLRISMNFSMKFFAYYRVFPIITRIMGQLKLVKQGTCTNEYFKSGFLWIFPVKLLIILNIYHYNTIMQENIPVYRDWKLSKLQKEELVNLCLSKGDEYHAISKSIKESWKMLYYTNSDKRREKKVRKEQKYAKI